jgi:hypothetical protein
VVASAAPIHESQLFDAAVTVVANADVDSALPRVAAELITSGQLGIREKAFALGFTTSGGTVPDGAAVRTVGELQRLAAVDQFLSELQVTATDAGAGAGRLLSAAPATASKRAGISALTDYLFAASASDPREVPTDSLAEADLNFAGIGRWARRAGGLVRDRGR